MALNLAPTQIIPARRAVVVQNLRPDIDGWEGFSVGFVYFRCGVLVREFELGLGLELGLDLV